MPATTSLTKSEKMVLEHLQDKFEILRNGWPDFLCVDKSNPSRLVFVEVKGGADFLRDSQLNLIRALSFAGIPVNVVHVDVALIDNKPSIAPDKKYTIVQQDIDNLVSYGGDEHTMLLAQRIEALQAKLDKANQAFQTVSNELFDVRRMAEHAVSKLKELVEIGEEQASSYEAIEDKFIADYPEITRKYSLATNGDNA